MSVSHDNRSDVQKTGSSVGSMIINPLLYDLTCETTGGLRFVHEHDLAVDSPSCGSKCGCLGSLTKRVSKLELSPTKSNFLSKLQTTKPWLMSTAVATSCQHTTHVSHFSFRYLWLMSTAVATWLQSCQWILSQHVRHC